MPNISYAETTEAMGDYSAVSRVCRNHMSVDSQADAPRFHCPACDAATPHTFQVDPYGDKSDGWMCKSCGKLNTRTARASLASARQRTT
jgi:transposase-like protein